MVTSQTTMCSSTSSSGGGDDYGLNRSKRQRVPKRGPGVAELEKILREQQDITHFEDDHDETSGGGFSSFMPPASISLPARNVSGLPDPALFAQFLRPLNRNGHGNGTSGLGFPEKGVMPVLTGTEMEGSKVYAGLPFTAQLRNGSDQQAQMFPSQMINYFQQPGPPYAPLSAGLYEPPSTQRPHRNYTTDWLEEDKTCAASAKRQRTFYDENPPLCPPIIPHHLLPPSIQKLDASFSKNHAIFSTRKSFRDTAAVNHLERTTKKCVTDGSNFIFDAAAAPLPSSQIPPQEFSKFRSFPFQEVCEVSHRRPEHDAPKFQKPLYTFLFDEQTIGAEATAPSLNNEKCEPRDGIDLNLKL